jgi:hypothetical protein
MAAPRKPHARQPRLARAACPTTPPPAAEQQHKHTPFPAPCAEATRPMPRSRPCSRWACRLGCAPRPSQPRPPSRLLRSRCSSRSHSHSRSRSHSRSSSHSRSHSRSHSHSLSHSRNPPCCCRARFHCRYRHQWRFRFRFRSLLWPRPRGSLPAT